MLELHTVIKTRAEVRVCKHHKAKCSFYVMGEKKTPTKHLKFIKFSRCCWNFFCRSIYSSSVAAFSLLNMCDRPSFPKNADLAEFSWWNWGRISATYLTLWFWLRVQTYPFLPVWGRPQLRGSVSLKFDQMHSECSSEPPEVCLCSGGRATEGEVLNVAVLPPAAAQPLLCITSTAAHDDVYVNVEFSMAKRAEKVGWWAFGKFYLNSSDNPPKKCQIDLHLL